MQYGPAEALFELIYVCTHKIQQTSESNTRVHGLGEFAQNSLILLFIFRARAIQNKLRMPRKIYKGVRFGSRYV